MNFYMYKGQLDKVLKEMESDNIFWIKFFEYAKDRSQHEEKFLNHLRTWKNMDLKDILGLIADSRDAGIDTIRYAKIQIYHKDVQKYEAMGDFDLCNMLKSKIKSEFNSINTEFIRSIVQKELSDYLQ